MSQSSWHRGYGDVATLEQKGLLELSDGQWRTNFAKRNGAAPTVNVVGTPSAENRAVVSRLRWLIEEQDVRPQDILVLSYARNRVKGLAECVRRAGIRGVEEIHVAFEDRDRLLGERGRLTFSTVASAKGYDAYCVLLASANEFPVTVQGRASFYVGATRAIEWLEVSGYSKNGLVEEFRQLVK